MQLTKTSLLTGKTTTREVNLTEAELEAYYAGDRPIQQLYPMLPAEDREFIMTGITPEEWRVFCADSESEQEEDDKE